ncbi:hypothetical protein [Microbacterium sp. B35-04]|uniref:hypothetical protein n=1 Tax=Microbacterium sp. B35-04 TaxID=1961716 RepID=UPI0013D8A1E9|nr:hypothetical protein [Microbacterium sp. B35-04]
MLTSLLPGLRDLRVPLAAGFLWLVVLWLCVYPAIPTQLEASGLIAQIYRLFGAFGSAALITVVTFVAYLVGILVVRPTSSVVQLAVKSIQRVSGRRTRSMRDRAYGETAELLERGRRIGPPPLSPSSQVEAEQLATVVATEMFEARVAFPPVAGETSESQYFREQLAELMEKPRDSDRFASPMPQDVVAVASLEVQNRMLRDIPLVATRLLADNRDLFDRYDRADSEADFRFAIALPVLVVSALVPWRMDLEWWGFFACVAVGLGVCGLLMLDGARKRIESNDAIYQAVFVDQANFPSVSTVRTAIEQKQAEERRRQ